MTKQRYVELYNRYHDSKVTPEDLIGELKQSTKKELVTLLFELVFDLNINA